MKQGFIHLYTGNGKGKTTASMGLMLRALGAGFKVGFFQFVKNGDYSEIIALTKIEESSFHEKLTIKQFGNIRKVNSPFTDTDKKAAEKGFKEVKKIIDSEIYDLIIMDELNIALHYKLVKQSDILKLLKTKPKPLELVITGRYATDEIIEAADLVTVMENRKHYADKGVYARKGIEN